VWLDGTQVAALSASTSLGTTGIGRISLGQTGKNHVFDAAFDGVVVDTSFIAEPDSQPPSEPSGLAASDVRSHAVELSWDASQDDVAVTGYTIYRSDDGGATYRSVGTTSTETAYTDMSVSPSTPYRYRVDAFDGSGHHSTPSDPVDVATPTAFSTPIRHVVVIDQENHSFDNVLGALCAEIASGQITGHDPCDGATSGTTSTGATIPLAPAADIVPEVDHSVGGQQAAMDGGAMDGFDHQNGCKADSGYACYSQYDPVSGTCGLSGTETCIPNLATLAERFVISDRTFEFATTPSWAGHMVLGSATLDGFNGQNSKPSTFTSLTGPGWGCDSYNDAPWWDGTQYVLEPSCIPDRAGNGPYRSSPVPYVPTIFDRLDNADLSWKIYGGSNDGESGGGWGWTICPTFYECLGSGQRNNLVAASNVIPDAAAGDLPSYSVVTPTAENSQHNHNSMAVGDNWIGQVVSALESGPDWATTAIFITYDDCGCFYDHVAPPQGSWGIRVPMVIVSPLARAGFTDSTPATYSSLLAYTETAFGLAPLTSADAAAYDYSGSFDYAQQALAPAAMTHTHVSRAERRSIATHPSPEEAT
jgi:phospholipase C